MSRRILASPHSSYKHRCGKPAGLTASTATRVEHERQEARNRLTLCMECWSSALCATWLHRVPPFKFAVAGIFAFCIIRALAVLSRLAKAIVILAAVQILGGHWMAMQSVAWIGMLAKYSRGESLVVAAEKTFDGQHPCSLCEVVKTGREQEQKQQTTKILLKIDAVLAVVLEVPVPLDTRHSYPRQFWSAANRTIAPPTPPPLVA